MVKELRALPGGDVSATAGAHRRKRTGTIGEMVTGKAATDGTARLASDAWGDVAAFTVTRKEQDPRD